MAALESNSQVLPLPLYRMRTMNGDESLADLTERQPVLLVFLRHFGCSFCREAISDIARRRKAIEDRGVRIVLVHMAPTRAVAERFLKRYKLFPVDHISDPDKEFYREFGLGRGKPEQLFGLMSWIRGFQAGVLEGHGFTYNNEEIGDGFQMPGIFVLSKGEIRNSFIHRHSHDRPDYIAIVGCADCQ
jgi:peroxiredoxin